MGWEMCGDQSPAQAAAGGPRCRSGKRLLALSLMTDVMGGISEMHLGRLGVEMQWIQQGKSTQQELYLRQRWVHGRRQSDSR